METSPCSPPTVALDDSAVSSVPIYGCMASSDWSGRSRTGAYFVLQCLHDLSVLFPGGAGTSGGVILRLLVLLGRYGSVVGDCSP